MIGWVTMGDMDDGFVEENPLWKRRVAIERMEKKIEKVENRMKSNSADRIDIAMVRDAIASYLQDDVFADRFATCIEIIRRKNADYSQSEQKIDRIAAFKRIARDIDVPVRKAWAVFAQKHWGAVMRYVKEGLVESEPIDGRINDMINYLVLFGAIIDWERTIEGEMR